MKLNLIMYGFKHREKKKKHVILLFEFQTSGLLDDKADTHAWCRFGTALGFREALHVNSSEVGCKKSRRLLQLELSYVVTCRSLLCFFWI